MALARNLKASVEEGARAPVAMRFGLHTEALVPELPPQQIALDVLAEKYLQPGESNTDDIFQRVAAALAAVEQPSRRMYCQQRFLENLRMGAVGAGRIMHAAGTSQQATLINCFVQPIGDCMRGVDQDGLPGLLTALEQAALTLRLGGGVGYDFSRLPPRAAHAGHSHASDAGVCHQIDRFDWQCTEIGSSGIRRGAQMAVLRIDHPDVIEFVNAKRTPNRWRNFNLSLAISDQFMRALAADAMWDLTHRIAPKGPLQQAVTRQRHTGLWVYRSLPARALWDVVMRAAYDLGEPGVLFIDAIRRDNNLRAIETIDATNPCGEQPLPAYGACDLGPLILPKFVRYPFGVGGEPAFDFRRFTRAVTWQVRALDNVLEISQWPLPQQRAEALAKRRIGVGFTGLADALTMLMLRYDSAEGRAMAANIARHMRDAAYRSSIALAKEKGAFPLFDAQQMLAPGTFASRLPAHIKDAICQHGLRNSHLLSIAPAGTVSLAFADNTSNGIEPAFGWRYTRSKRDLNGRVKAYTVEDHAWRVYRALGGDIAALPACFVSALEIGPEDHIAMVQTVQPYIDAGISKTVNIPNNYPYSLFKTLYQRAWAANLKGLSTYPQHSPLGAVLATRLTTAAGGAAQQGTCAR